MTERTTVRLPEELLRRARHKASAQGRTLTSLIEEGLRLVIAEKRKARPLKRSSAPVSAASGGLMPGIDINSFSKIQEVDDFEYLTRTIGPK